MKNTESLSAIAQEERLANLELDIRFSLACLKNTLNRKMDIQDIITKVRQAVKTLEEALKQEA